LGKHYTTYSEAGCMIFDDIHTICIKFVTFKFDEQRC
jgi:hypothetical protein